MPRQQCACGAKYSLPDSAVGKRAKCKRCGEVFVVTVDATLQKTFEEPFGVTDEIEQAVERSKQVRATPVVRPTPAPDSQDGIPAANAGRIIACADTPTPQNQGSFIKMLSEIPLPMSAANLITFLVIWTMLCFSTSVLGMAPLIGILAQFVILAWYCAFRLNVLYETASGSDDLPSLQIEDGWVQDVVAPALQWLASWLIVMLPAVLYFAFALDASAETIGSVVRIASRGLSGIMDTDESNPGVLVFFALGYFGMFMWPMVVLSVSMGGFTTILRADLMVFTIIRSASAYVVAAITVIGSHIVVALVTNWLATELVSPSGTVRRSELWTLNGLIWMGSITAIGLFFEILSMRAIGLYYRHFKHRFAWSWE